MFRKKIFIFPKYADLHTVGQFLRITLFILKFPLRIREKD